VAIEHIINRSILKFEEATSTRYFIWTRSSLLG